MVVVKETRVAGVSKDLEKRVREPVGTLIPVEDEQPGDSMQTDPRASQPDKSERTCHLSIHSSGHRFGYLGYLAMI